MNFYHGRRWRVLFLGLFLAGPFFGVNTASALNFSQLNQGSIDPVLQAFSAATTFRSLEGPSHPKVWGVFFNVRASVVSSSALESLLGPGQSFLPFGHVQAGLNLPMGLGFEMGYVPSVSLSGLTVGSLGLGLKFNLNTKVLRSSPVDLTLRAIYTDSSVSYLGDLSGLATTIDVHSAVVGGSLDVGKIFLGYLQPYVGLGVLSQNSSMGYTGSASIFGSSVSLANGRATSDTTAVWLKAGLELIFYGLNLGVQYDQAFGNDVFSLKAGLKF
jgi:hypothetical protein